MAEDVSTVGWSLRHVREGARFEKFLLHLLACARDRDHGVLASHHGKTDRAEVAPGEAFMNERRFRQAELSVAAAVGGGRGSSRPDPGPAAGQPQSRADFDPTHDLTNLIANAEAVGIAVTWCEIDVEIGGFVYRPPDRMARRRDPRVRPRDVDARSLPTVSIGDLVVVLNPAQAWVDTFEVVLHELAHALLGHLGPRPSVRQAPLLIASRERPTWDVAELEASSAAFLVAVRRGARLGRQPLRLMTHFANLEHDGALVSVDLLEVFRVAEILSAWCRMRPQSVGVLAPRGPRPAGPAVGRAGPGDDRERAGHEVLA